MKLPEYVTIAEVKRVCKELKIRDWTELSEPTVLQEEARVILSEINPEGISVPLEDFSAGLDVELEHGIRYKEANVTNNHPILTGQIVVAHLKESLDYYRLLAVAELEGDLLKAVVKGDASKIKSYYKRLAMARISLRQSELSRLD